MFPSAMKTGLVAMETPSGLDEETTAKIKIILNRYMVEAIKDAAEYCHSAGRKTLTSTDIEYALKYQAHKFVIDDTLLDDCEEEYVSSRTAGVSATKRTLWADVEEDTDSDEEDLETDSDEEDLETDSDEEELTNPFTRCEGSGQDKINKMNEYYDTWEGWEPPTDIHRSIKKSIDNTFNFDAV